MFSLTRLSAADSSLSQPEVSKRVIDSRRAIPRRGISIEEVSAGILPGGGGEVKGICKLLLSSAIWSENGKHYWIAKSRLAGCASSLSFHAAEAGDTPAPPKSVSINVTFDDSLKAPE